VSGGSYDKFAKDIMFPSGRCTSKISAYFNHKKEIVELKKLLRPLCLYIFGDYA